MRSRRLDGGVVLSPGCTLELPEVLNKTQTLRHRPPNSHPHPKIMMYLSWGGSRVVWALGFFKSQLLELLVYSKNVGALRSTNILRAVLDLL